jgi:chromosome segregation ATPase
MEFTSPYTPQCCDLEQRLKALQIDYAALQSSHDKLEEEKVAGGREGQAMREDLEMLRYKLKKAEEEMENLRKDKESVSEELKQFKLSLEHQLANQKLLTEVSWCWYHDM